MINDNVMGSATRECKYDPNTGVCTGSSDVPLLVFLPCTPSIPYPFPFGGGMFPAGPVSDPIAAANTQAWLDWSLVHTYVEPAVNSLAKYGPEYLATPLQNAANFTGVSYTYNGVTYIPVKKK